MSVQRFRGYALAALVGIAAMAWLPVGDAVAAARDPARQALFSRMMADPGNVDIALQYAELSARAGDPEGAISTLERLLIFSPNLARLNFELGVLYQQIGAYDLASAYFKTASAAPDATPDMRAQIAAYLAGGDMRTAADKTMGSLIFGARYQSNANSGAGSPWVDLNGVQFNLSPAAQADPDSNGFIAGNMHFSHDLAAQGDRFDVDVATYASGYLKHDELNTLAGEMRFGPVYNLERLSIAHSTLGIYGILGAVGLKGQPYVYSAGAGAAFTTQLDPATQARARLEYRYEEFVNSLLRPSVADMTGARTRLSGDISHQLNDRVAIYALAYGERKNAVLGLDADWEAGVALGGTIRFPSPIANGPGPWSLDLSAGVLQRSFDAPDPVVSASPRVDHEAFVQGALTVPVTESWSVIGTLGYRKSMSNYGLYTYDNFSTSLAAMKSF